MRPTAVRVARPLAQPARCFSLSARAMAEGDVAKGGSASGNTFGKREAAAEELYIRQAEQQKLRALHSKIEAQEKTLGDLKAGLKDLMKESDRSK